MTVLWGRASALAATLCLIGMAAPPPDRRPAVLPTIRVDSNLVLVPVSVTDQRNHAVTGLSREAFRVYEDRTEQPLVQFAREDAPVSVGIVFDTSGSMGNKLAPARAAVARFLAEANPQDEFFLVNFNSTAQLAVPFTSDPGDIQSHLLFTQSDGRTALLDAVCLAMETMRRSTRPRKALLIISDGGDNDSRYAEAEIRDRVRESDLWIYTIGIYDSRTVMLPEGDHGERLLASLAEESGGRHFAVHSAAELPDIAGRIGLELRNQYVIGYRPAAMARSGKYHRVQIKVDGRDLRVTWRPGYFEPR